MTIKGSLQVSMAIVKAFLTRNFLPSKIGQNFRSGGTGKWGRNETILFSGSQKAHPFYKRRHLNRCRGLGCRQKEEPKKN